MLRFFTLIGILAVSLNVAVAAEKPDLSGTWVLNNAESEFPANAGMDEPAAMAKRRSTLTISGTADELKMVVTGSEGPMGNTREEILKPGAGPQQVLSFSGEVTVEADWEDGKLAVKRLSVLENPRGDSIKVSHRVTWELSSDGGKLTQRIQVKNPRGTSYIKMVYDKH